MLIHRIHSVPSMVRRRYEEGTEKIRPNDDIIMIIKTGEKNMENLFFKTCMTKVHIFLKINFIFDEISFLKFNTTKKVDLKSFKVPRSQGFNIRNFELWNPGTLIK